MREGEREEPHEEVMMSPQLLKSLESQVYVRHPAEKRVVDSLAAVNISTVSSISIGTWTKIVGGGRVGGGLPLNTTTTDLE